VSRGRIVTCLIFAAGLLVPASADAFPDEKIVFASNRDGTYDIWSMNPDGSGQTKVAGNSSDNEYAPSVSRDGSRILFMRGGSPGGREADIWVTNVDGTEERLLARCYSDPAWSPNDAQIAIGTTEGNCYTAGLYRMNADGTGQTLIRAFSNSWSLGPSWSPDGQTLAFTRTDFNTDEIDVWKVNADGTNPTRLTQQADPTIADEDPDWSPNGSQIAFARLGSIWLMSPDGSGQAQVGGSGARGPAWSPPGSRIAFSGNDSDDEIYAMNADGSAQSKLTDNTTSDVQPDWGVLQGPGYARPRGATPLRAPLAIAYKPCTSPNREHGPPLAVPSCSQPVMQSDFLTVGTLDANAMPARSEGAVRFDVVPDKSGTVPDETDVKLGLEMTDVFTKALADYSGELRTTVSVQSTDKNNTPSPGVNATTEKFRLAFTAGCTPTADTTLGSVCSATTSVNAITAGTLKGGFRSIWELGQVEVFDGGPDGLAGTTFGNTLFATEGIFAP
jgi:WD40 repeat protein